MQDRAQLRDELTASLERVPVDPVNPCPRCGSESRVHRDAERIESTERVCSKADCRKVQPAPTEQPSINGSPRFPCAECGRETKEHRGPVFKPSAERICTNAECGEIFG